MPRLDPKRVFINVPFDKAYEPLFITLVGTLVFLGQKPHCVLEVTEMGEGRLVRILDLMRTCRLSIHDLSRTGIPVRFNMPFELGLACAIQYENPTAYDIIVMDAKPYRLDRTLSDYKGRDPLIHRGTCDGMQACLLDAFRTEAVDATVEFQRAAKGLRESINEQKRQMKSPTVFRPALFRSLVDGATDLAIARRFVTR